MPLINLRFSSDIDTSKTKELLPELSQIISECTGKPEQYVMAIIDNSEMIFSGKRGGCAFGVIKSIGNLTQDVNVKISSAISNLLKDQLKISPERVYLNFVEVERKDWGFNGKTFA